LSDGYLGTVRYLRSSRGWAQAPSIPRSDTIDLSATNLASASIDVKRAHVSCHVTLHVKTDGPITISLPGCNRAQRFS
jgi:hypothetical protein